MLHKWFSLYWRYVFWFSFASAILTPIGLNYYIQIVTSPYRHSDLTKIPPETIAIVFGAGLWDDGTPSPMLADRIQGAVDLYRIGRVRKLLMTGDNSADDYNEVKAMKIYAENQGVAKGDITLDYAGFSTYESCYRAKEIFGVKQAILITQSYHLPRAVYTCRALGIKAIGLGTTDWGKYSDELVREYSIREIFAIVKAVWEVHITRPKPTFLGPLERISGTGDRN